MLSALEIYLMKKFPFPNKKCYPTKTGPINFDKEEIGNFRSDCSAFLIKLNLVKAIPYQVMMNMGKTYNNRPSLRNPKP